MGGSQVAVHGGFAGTRAGGAAQASGGGVGGPLVESVFSGGYA